LLESGVEPKSTERRKIIKAIIIAFLVILPLFPFSAVFIAAKDLPRA
jgi:hypothetical protein